MGLQYLVVRTFAFSVTANAEYANSGACIFSFCWRPSSLEYVTTANDYTVAEELEITCPGGNLSMKRVPSMQVLGTLVTEDGDPLVQLDFSLERGDRAYWANHDALTCKDIPLRKRLQLYVERVVSAVCHSAGAFVYCQATHQRLVAWEGAKLRGSIGYKKEET